MNFDEALQILGLDTNFTEEELRKKYLNLVKMYHPDTLIGKSEKEIESASEKMKDINLAYEILKKDKKSSFIYKQTNNNDLNFYKKNISKIINNYNWVKITSKKEFRGDIVNNFKSLFINFIFDVDFAPSKEEVDKLFIKFKKNVKDWYIKLKDIYFKEHNIPENTNFIINEDLPFDEFYNNLEKVKNQSSSNIIKEVNDIVDKYKLYTYYNDLETKIEELKQETIKLLNISQINYLNLKEKYLSDLKDNIEELFKRISKNKPLYLEMAQKVEEQNLSFKEYLNYLHDYMLDVLFPIYYEHLKYKLNYLEYFDKRKEIGKIITINYSNVLTNVNDFKYQILLTELYKKIINLLDINNSISIESLWLLSEIDFNNYDEALKIYDKVKRNLITLKDIDISICKDDIGICGKHIKIDDEEYNISSNDETIINESYPILENKISLNEFMEKAGNLFMTFKWNGEDVIGLYKLGSIILGIYKGRLEFFNGIGITNVEYQNGKNFGMYKDREYVKNMIINEYYKEIKLNKEQNINNNDLRRRK